MKEIKVLDKGFVKLIDYMGNDESITNAARVSYGDGTKTVNDNRNLIRYLLRNKHTTPFEMVVFKFLIKCPIFVTRQWHRHRTWSYNEESARYSIMKNEFYIPEINRLTKQSKNNKQGSSSEILENSKEIQRNIENQTIADRNHYEWYLDNELARETSRITLPLNTYTQFYGQVNLHNLLHFLKLRMDNHAQYEIRIYADAIYKLIKDIVPITIEAFDDYYINSKTFSGIEMDIIKEILKGNKLEENNLKDKMSNREILEFKEKIGWE